MKKYFLVASLMFFVSCKQQPEKRPVEYVNPFICTQDDHGHWHPSALVPFGTVKLGPDSYPGTFLDGDFAHSGYNFSDTQIRGFSHFHLGGFGGTTVSDRSGILSLFPYAAERTGVALTFPIADIDKSKEVAEPGYYSVYIEKDDILAECAATTHSGHHRYTFPEGSDARIILYDGQRSKTTLACRKVDEYTLEGELPTHGVTFYYTMNFNKPLVSSSVFDDTGCVTTFDDYQETAGGGFICRFGDLQGEPLYVKVGVSLTSLNAAKENYNAECNGTTFEEVKENASGLWNELISRIKVSGGTEDNKTIFYTSLFHCCFLPVSFTDVTGTYPGYDGEIHQADDYTYYSGYAFWDEVRTKYPLFSLFVPDVYSDITSSLLNIAEQTSLTEPLEDWQHNPHGAGTGFKYKGKNGDVWGECHHEHQLMTMVDAQVKGIMKPSLERAYPAIRKEIMIQMPERYDEIGFIPQRPDQTCEFSWDNFCVALMAKELGKTDEYAYFMKRAGYWKNNWDPSIHFFRARAANGNWLDFPNDPADNREKYTYEGSKWQIRWNVLHDIPGLIDIMGGKRPFIKALDYFFVHDLYTAGNQIDLQAPFLFNIAGAPWLTQKWAHKITTEPIIQKYGTHRLFPKPIYGRVFKTTPDGMLEEMDDDFACMSAWFALSAMGLYQVCPGIPDFELFSPIFEEIILKVPGDKTFTIEAKNYAPDSYYIQSAMLNGKPYDKCTISYKEIMAGGKLEYVMGKQPNKSWGLKR